MVALEASGVLYGLSHLGIEWSGAEPDTRSFALRIRYEGRDLTIWLSRGELGVFVDRILSVARDARSDSGGLQR